MNAPILVASGIQGDTRRYRTFHLFQQLKLLGINAALSHLTDAALPSLIDSADVIILHRAAMDHYLESLLNRARQHGALLIYDTDDLIFDPQAFDWIDSPDFSDPVRRKLYLGEMERQRLTLQACDAVLVSTDYLARQVARLGKPVWVHRNAFSLEMLAASILAMQNKKGKSDEIVIGYASGTLTHNRDFAKLTPALQKVLDANPSTQMRIIGSLELGAEWHRYKTRIHISNFVHWMELPQHLANFDINIAPLVLDNPFSQSKSEIKFVEAGLVGVPTIASAADAFKTAIIHGENGLLASRLEEWEVNLNSLVASQALRRQMGERARQSVLADYHPLVRANQLAQTLDQINCRVRGQSLWSEDVPQALQPSSPEAFWVDGKLEEHPGLTERAWYILSHRGIGTLLGQMWVYFRRLIAPIFPFGG
jgi:glycosyltransferase involved in cell wall biosynthesis